jgi:hypothetical protein
MVPIFRLLTCGYIKNPYRRLKASRSLFANPSATCVILHDCQENCTCNLILVHPDVNISLHAGLTYAASSRWIYDWPNETGQNCGGGTDCRTNRRSSGLHGGQNEYCDQCTNSCTSLDAQPLKHQTLCAVTTGARIIRLRRHMQQGTV